MPTVAGQADIATLEIEVEDDEYWTQEHHRFLSQSGKILHRHDSVDVPGGAAVHRPARNMDSVECGATAEGVGSKSLKDRLRIKERFSTLEEKRDRLRYLMTDLASREQHRYELNDVTMQVILHHRGMASAAEEHLKGTAAQKHALRIAVEHSASNCTFACASCDSLPQLRLQLQSFGR